MQDKTYRLELDGQAFDALCAAVSFVVAVEPNVIERAALQRVQKAAQEAVRVNLRDKERL